MPTSTFFSYLIAAYDRHDDIGQMARFVVQRSDYPHGANLDRWKRWLIREYAPLEIVRAMERAWEEFHAEDIK